MFIRRIKRIVLEKESQFNLYMLVLGLAFLPFLILSAYVQPFADDFWITNIAINKGSWSAQIEIRQTWSGRYFAMFLGSINPLVYSSLMGYKVVPVMLLLVTLASLYFLISRILPSVSTKYRLSYALLLQVLYLGFMPAIAAGYYWMSSALNYQTAIVFLLLLAGGLLNYRRKRTPKQTAGYLLSLSFLVFAGIGCNELSMLLILEIIIGLLAYDYWRFKRWNKLLLYFLLLAFGCSLFVVLSPGNLARLQTHSNHSNLPYSLAYALAVTINNTFNYLTLSPLLILTVLFIPLSQKLFRNWNFVKILHPAISTAALYFIIFQCFFVIYWNRGMHAPIWAQNFIYFIFLGGWFLNAGLCTQYYQAKGVSLQIKIPLYARILLLSACFLHVFHNKQSNVRMAYFDWVSGKAAAYDQELKNRYAYLKNSNCTTCPVKDLVNRPKTIYFRQEPYLSDFDNTLYARYFGKKQIIIRY